MTRLTVLLALAATAGLAQAPAPPSAANTTYTIESSSTTCPIGFAATRRPGTGAAMSADTQQQPGPAQGLHLVLTHDDKPAIQSITVTVYAVPPTLRALPLAATPDDTISRTVELNRQPGYDSLREANVWMHKVGSISRVDLISITYADGTTWHSTPNLQCRVTPSNFVLVTRR